MLHEVSKEFCHLNHLNMHVLSLTFLRLFGRDCTNAHQLQMLELFSNCAISSIGKILASKDVNAYENFFHLVESHVLAAAMEFLGMENIDNKPADDIFPSTLWLLHQEERRSIVISVCEATVDEIVDLSTIDVSDTETGMKKRTNIYNWVPIPINQLGRSMTRKKIRYLLMQWITLIWSAVQGACRCST